MIEELNDYGKRKIPILFIIDFDIKNPIIIPLDKVNKKEILYNINGKKNYNNKKNKIKKNIVFKKYPVKLRTYKKAFKKVKKELYKGNSFLLNLTFPTRIRTNLTFKEIFYNSIAKYKLLYKDLFIVFSPEQFVTIMDNKISSFPMKGTINASIPGAKEKILADEKEFAEHITIVDLIRNDLGIISKEVIVDNFRYIDEVFALEQNLLQVSSKITGILDKYWNNRLGDIIYSLLPAGSVTGAPKKKTVEIIKNAENYDRGYYTGIFGYFDGEILDSSVMIRFMEKKDDKFFFKSGGGITIYSKLKYEYKELKDKVYVPFNRDNKD